MPTPFAQPLLARKLLARELFAGVFLARELLDLNSGNSGNSGYRQHILIALLCDFFVASDLSCKAVVRSNGV